jgi:hypothetical protein
MAAGNRENRPIGILPENYHKQCKEPGWWRVRYPTRIAFQLISFSTGNQRSVRGSFPWGFLESYQASSHHLIWYEAGIKLIPSICVPTICALEPAWPQTWNGPMYDQSRTRVAVGCPRYRARYRARYWACHLRFSPEITRASV